MPNDQDYWGASRATARSVVLLFGKLAFQEILDQKRKQQAMELLSGVVPFQRWGVTAGVPDELPPGTIIGLKDGWYPAGFGWWVNSAGMLIPGDDRPAYTIAVFDPRPAHLGVWDRNDRGSREESSRGPARRNSRDRVVNSYRPWKSCQDVIDRSFDGGYAR